MSNANITLTPSKNEKEEATFSFNLSLNDNNKTINYSIVVKQFKDFIQFNEYEINEIKGYSQNLPIKDFLNFNKNFRVYDSISDIFIFLKNQKIKKEFQ